MILGGGKIKCKGDTVLMKQVQVIIYVLIAICTAASGVYGAMNFFTPRSNHEALKIEVAGFSQRLEIRDVREEISYYHRTHDCMDLQTCHPKMDAETFHYYERLVNKYKDMMKVYK